MSDQNSTWIIELVVVVLAVMVGVVFMANRWPGPDLPVIIAGAATVLYLAYAVGSHVLTRRSGKADGASAGASSRQQPSAQQQQAPQQPMQQQPMQQPPMKQPPMQQQPARNQQVPNQPPPNQPAQPLNPAAFQAPKPAAQAAPSVEVGEASEDPTSLHDLEELRPETDADLTTSPGQSVPEFAQNTMQVSHQRLADGARKLRQKEQAQQPSPEAEKTDLTPLQRLKSQLDAEEDSSQ